MIVIQELHQCDGELRLPQPSAAHEWDGQNWVFNADMQIALDLQEAERLCTKVDTTADSARSALAGDPLKAVEYAQAAADAQAFQDAGYPKKEVPLSVAAWVVKGRTAKQAAEQILTKAEQLTDHLLTLRTLRLKAKAQIRAQAGKGKIDLARGAADEALIAIGELASGLSS
ncbi:phage tail protein [Pseudomonas moraviensis subsp. stanleyae]|uniref:phage tail protein n=1 Tax=Pseudomonas moraviensis TaxID=321662 RepID=UPI002E303997|nr:phage tail protein [Pseudomonas moraviensis]MED7670423.1 phage tail protein [Pseudomonas moraviensis subsp. stanleyae]